MQINIELAAPPIGNRLDIEVVERKGLGHPDSITDALAEAVSRALCGFYKDRFGLLLHHNVDKVLLCAGEAEPAFGGGRVTKPLEIFLAGRATSAYKGVAVPVADLAVEAAEAWLRGNLHGLDVAHDVRIHALIRPGSQDLVALYRRREARGVALANDTSCGVGFAPLSALESLVLAVEQGLSGPGFTETCPAVGEDIKVMGMRRGRGVDLTVACAAIGRHLRDLDSYLRLKDRLAERVRELAVSHQDPAVRKLALEVSVNAADDPTVGSVYLTVTGTSAEAGDDGQAGRGNRVNGLITPYRPMTMESVAGKNPVTHVGKLYNLCAGLLAERLVSDLPAVRAAQCCLVSRIGAEVTAPQVVDLQIQTVDGELSAGLRGEVEEVLHDELTRIPLLSNDLLAGRIALDRWPLRSQGAVAGPQAPA